MCVNALVSPGADPSLLDFSSREIRTVSSLQLLASVQVDWPGPPELRARLCFPGTMGRPATRACALGVGCGTHPWPLESRKSSAGCSVGPSPGEQGAWLLEQCLSSTWHVGCCRGRKHEGCVEAVPGALPLRFFRCWRTREPQIRPSTVCGSPGFRPVSLLPLRTRSLQV